MERDGFVFYKSFAHAIERLPEEKWGKAYHIVCQYALYGEEPEIEDPIMGIILDLVKPQIDANNKRYENGQKGGRGAKKKKEKETNDVENEEPKDKEKETDGSESENQWLLNDKPKVYEKETDGSESANQRFQNEKPKEKEKDNVKEKGEVFPFCQPSADTETISLQDERFDEFWKLYPKKQGKGAAKKAWLKIRPTAELHQEIMKALRSNVGNNPQWKKEHGQYIPNPATWLNQCRWEDGRPWEEPGYEGYVQPEDINASQKTQMEWLLNSIREDELGNG